MAVQEIEFDELQSVFDDVDDQFRGIDYGETLKGLTADLRRQHDKQFQTGTDSTGTAWTPLKESTVRRKGHGIILVDTEDMMNSLTQEGAQNSISDIGGRNGSILGRLLFGTSDPKAAKHQFGIGVPARPPVGVSEETLGKMTNDVADATVEGLKK